MAIIVGDATMMVSATLENFYFLTAMGFFHTKKYRYYPINI